jgi:hypothetical protein
MMRANRFLLAAIVFLVFFSCMTPAVAAEKSSWQLDWDKTIQAARQEGQIVIYAAIGPYHPQIFTEFQKDYPEIKATIVHGNSNRISPRLLAERRAGKFLADVYLGGPTSLYSFYQNKLFDPLAPLLVLPEVVDASLWWEGKHWYIDPERKHIFVNEGSVAGLTIKRDGAVVNQAQWGVAVPVDGGAHAITATAPKKKPWQGSVEVKGEATATSIPLPAQLDDAPEAAAPPAKEGAPSTPQDAAPRGGVPAWAWVLGGVGLAGVGVSVGFLMDERGAQSSIDQSCTAKTCAKGFDAHAANGRLYRGFDVFVGAGVVGVVALGASIAGIATAPKKQKSAAIAPPVPWLAPGAGGLGWRGRF